MTPSESNILIIISHRRWMLQKNKGRILIVHWYNTQMSYNKKTTSEKLFHTTLQDWGGAATTWLFTLTFANIKTSGIIPLPLSYWVIEKWQHCIGFFNWSVSGHTVCCVRVFWQGNQTFTKKSLKDLIFFNLNDLLDLFISDLWR